MSKGQADTIIAGATSVMEHKADPIGKVAGKDETGKDIPIVKTEGAQADDEYELELPKGSLLTQEDLNEIAEEAGRLNLSKADAEKLLTQREAAFKKGQSAFESKYNEKIETAKKEISSHADFIGENKVKTFESIGRVVKHFGDDNLVKALNTPEIGNNLALALFLKRLGDAMASDTFEGKGASSAQQEHDAAKENTLKTLYPGFFQQK